MTVRSFPMPSHQRLRLHKQQRLCQFLLSQQQAGQHESEPLDGHQRWSLAQPTGHSTPWIVPSEQRPFGRPPREHTPQKKTAPRGAVQRSHMVECPGLTDKPAGPSEASHRHLTCTGSPQAVRKRTPEEFWNTTVPRLPNRHNMRLLLRTPAAQERGDFAMLLLL